MTIERLKEMCADDHTREIVELAHQIGVMDGRGQGIEETKQMIDRILGPRRDPEPISKELKAFLKGMGEGFVEEDIERR